MEQGSHVLAVSLREGNVGTGTGTYLLELSTVIWNQGHIGEQFPRGRLGVEPRRFGLVGVTGAHASRD